MRWELSAEQELFTTSLREWLGERAGSATVRGWLDAGDLLSFERFFVGEGSFNFFVYFEGVVKQLVHEIRRVLKPKLLR